MPLRNRKKGEFLTSRIILLALLILPSAGFAADSSAKDLVDHGHFKRARTMLEDQLSKNPKDAGALVLMARVKLAYGHLDEANKMLQEAVSLEPNSSDAHLYLANIYGREAEKAGWFEKIGLAHKVKKELQQATLLDPKNMDALEGMMEFYLEAPGVMGGSGKQAEEMASRILAIDAVRGNLSQGRIASHAKKFAKCEAYFQVAVSAAPQSYDALIAAADLYLQDHWNNPDKAADYAGKASRVDPSRVGSYNVLASVFAATDRWHELDEMLASAEKQVPDNLVPYFIAGRALIVNQKDPARAERYLRRYLSQEEPEGETPSFAAARWRLGLALERESRQEEAVREVQAAVRMDPGLHEAKIDLARLQSH